MDALEERMLVLKNKIANYKTRLLRTEEKSEAICEAIFEIFKVRQKYMPTLSEDRAGIYL